MTELEKLCKEYREEFQIPSYYSDNAVMNIAKASVSYFVNLGDVVLEDEVIRSLIKNRMFYSYNHQDSLFASDFAQDILTWQFSQIGGEKA